MNIPDEIGHDIHKTCDIRRRGRRVLTNISEATPRRLLPAPELQERIKELGMKAVCIKCDAEKPMLEFKYHKSTVTGETYRLARCYMCCTAESLARSKKSRAEAKAMARVAFGGNEQPSEVQ